MQLGIWKSVEELEDSVSIDELHRFYVMKQKEDYENKRFLAAIQGVKMDPYQDPDEGKEVSDFEALKRRADAKRRLILQGKNPDDYDNIKQAESYEDLSELEGIGFGVEWE